MAVCPLVVLPLDRLFVGVAAAHPLGTAVDGGTAWSSRTTAIEQGIEFLTGELEETATRGDAIVELGAARGLVAIVWPPIGQRRRLIRLYG